MDSEFADTKYVDNESPIKKNWVGKKERDQIDKDQMQEDNNFTFGHKREEHNEDVMAQTAMNFKVMNHINEKQPG